jgi:hypothetical protein
LISLLRDVLRRRPGLRQKASGMVAPHQGKDLVDVQELSRSAGLAREVVEGLHPWVREKFLEIWELAQAVDPF